EAKAKAEAIKAEIEGGADFATLAQENSVDTQSAVNGGDLGFFRRGMMVQPFEEAAFGLTEVGSVSEPVRSQYGWHIIKLEEKRQSAPPSFEQVAGQLQNRLLMTTFTQKVDELMSGVTVDI